MEDGEARLPLPFDEDLQPKPVYDVLLSAMENAEPHTPLRTPPRAD
jgi:endo-1,4-beta-xylanase